MVIAVIIIVVIIIIIITIILVMNIVIIWPGQVSDLGQTAQSMNEPRTQTVARSICCCVAFGLVGLAELAVCVVQFGCCFAVFFCVRSCWIFLLLISFLVGLVIGQVRLLGGMLAYLRARMFVQTRMLI